MVTVKETLVVAWRTLFDAYALMVIEPTTEASRRTVTNRDWNFKAL